MSETAIFVIGAIIFALTVYGAVVAGGLLLTRRALEENASMREGVDESEYRDGLPVNTRF